jgi:hypothetical protein
MGASGRNAATDPIDVIVGISDESGAMTTVHRARGKRVANGAARSPIRTRRLQNLPH